MVFRSPRAGARDFDDGRSKLRAGSGVALGSLPGPAVHVPGLTRLWPVFAGRQGLFLAGDKPDVAGRRPPCRHGGDLGRQRKGQEDLAEGLCGEVHGGKRGKNRQKGKNKKKKDKGKKDKEKKAGEDWTAAAWWMAMAERTFSAFHGRHT